VKYPGRQRTFSAASSGTRRTCVRVLGLGAEVQCLRFGVWGVGCGVWVWGFGRYGLVMGVWSVGLGSGVEG